MMPVADIAADRRVRGIDQLAIEPTEPTDPTGPCHLVMTGQENGEPVMWDSWHVTVAEAKEQALWAFGVREGDWRPAS